MCAVGRGPGTPLSLVLGGTSFVLAGLKGRSLDSLWSGLEDATARLGHCLSQWKMNWFAQLLPRGQ